jgi:hypothetical protein
VNITIALEDHNGQHHSATIDALDQDSLETIASKAAEDERTPP